MRVFLIVLTIFLYSVTAHATGQTLKQKDLGGMEPSQALKYMKAAKDLVIVDVATKRWYATNHFSSAVNIPIENISSNEAEELYRRIPSGRPVLLHCRLGMIAPGAYQTLKRLRSDIPEISYITGKPPFDEYNQWHEKHQ